MALAARRVVPRLECSAPLKTRASQLVLCLSLSVELSRSPFLEMRVRLPLTMKLLVPEQVLEKGPQRCHSKRSEESLLIFGQQQRGIPRHAACLGMTTIRVLIQTVKTRHTVRTPQ